ncbi:MAG: NAD(P)H-quinone oxidoreductase [bacterium]|nr:NAD(P)H-quinone oxidoreductase [bacterium]
MKAILLKSFGGAENLYLGETPDPIPLDREALVRVRATALNRADIMQRQGKYPPPPGASEILGLEFAGEIEKPVGRFAKGDRVMGIAAGGGYAQLISVPEGHLISIPDMISFEEAAAIPEAFLTAYQTLFWHGEFCEGDSVLIHAGASGVGTAVIQLAKAAGAKEILVTTSSEKKMKACLSLGASRAVNYQEEDFSKIVKTTTENLGVQVILDFIGSSYWEKNISSLALDGRLVLISTIGGSVVPEVNLAKLLQKRIKITATTLRSRSKDYKTKLTHTFAVYALDLFKAGLIKPVIDKVYDWGSVIEAHQRMESNKNIGKIILKVP